MSVLITYEILIWRTGITGSRIGLALELRPYQAIDQISKIGSDDYPCVIKIYVYGQGHYN